MQRSIIQKYALIYAAAFFLIVALNYIPAIHDDKGFMFGLFKLDPIDDAFHLLTAVWALLAGLASLKQSVIYFKVFGLLYTADSFICLILGQCLADFTIFTHSHATSLIDGAVFVERVLLNLPHLVIGGLALYIGFRLSKKITTE